MAWRFEVGEPLPAAFRRAALEESARIEAGLVAADDPEAAIHQARQGFKRLRALLRMARGGLGRDFKIEDRRWSDVGRLLAQSRQQTVLRQTLDRVIAKCPGLPAGEVAALQAAICEDRPRPSLSAKKRQTVLARIRSGRRRFAALPWPETPGELGDGIKAGASALRKRWRKASRRPAPEALHALRKRVKDHASQLRLLRNAAPEVVRKRRETCKEIAEFLGDERDLGILAETLSDRKVPGVREETRDVLLRHIAKRRKALWRRASKAAELCFEESPRALASSLTAAWAEAAPARPRSRSRRGRPTEAERRPATSR